MLVRELTDALLEAFPPDDAEDWDHIGLSVGDPDAAVSGVRCALDATLEHVRATAAAGANVLLTHHPVYLSAPDAFTPAAPERPACAAVVYEAARTGVSIVSLHTNLDRSIEARRALPALVGLSPRSSLEYAAEPARHGLGALCDVPACSLGALAAQLAHAFSTEPRVWGSAGAQLTRVAFLGGSLRHLGGRAMAGGAQAVICGEAGYHVAQDLVARGCALVLLGHDRSEEPFCAILADAARNAGITPRDIAVIPGSRQWWTVSEGELS